MAGWYTVEEAQSDWADWPRTGEDDTDTSLLASYLAAAKDAVLAYAPDSTDPEEPIIAEGWRIAQLMQARNIWNSGKASPSGDFDGGQYALSTFPLDWQVRQLVRPKRGMPVIL